MSISSTGRTTLALKSSVALYVSITPVTVGDDASLHIPPGIAIRQMANVKIGGDVRAPQTKRQLSSRNYIEPTTFTTFK